ncbi:MAG: ribonuclease P protein component 2 [Nanoarchaeota archaeon]|nr:ribonuclease P protein component 2 [Nanoarchaeota archaeon]
MILPSSREKKRYILFEVIGEEKVFKDEVKNSIYQKTLELLGEEGFSRAGVMLVGTNIVRVNPKFKDEMINILSLIRVINGKRVVINTLKTSGIIKKIKGEKLKHGKFSW